MQNNRRRHRRHRLHDNNIASREKVEIAKQKKNEEEKHMRFFEEMKMVELDVNFACVRLFETCITPGNRMLKCWGTYKWENMFNAHNCVHMYTFNVTNGTRHIKWNATLVANKPACSLSFHVPVALFIFGLHLHIHFAKLLSIFVCLGCHQANRTKKADTGNSHTHDKYTYCFIVHSINLFEMLFSMMISLSPLPFPFVHQHNIQRYTNNGNSCLINIICRNAGND